MSHSEDGKLNLLSSILHLPGYAKRPLGRVGVKDGHYVDPLIDDYGWIHGEPLILDPKRPYFSGLNESFESLLQNNV